MITIHYDQFQCLVKQTDIMQNIKIEKLRSKGKNSEDDLLLIRLQAISFMTELQNLNILVTKYS